MFERKAFQLELNDEFTVDNGETWHVVKSLKRTRGNKKCRVFTKTDAFVFEPMTIVIVR